MAIVEAVVVASSTDLASDPKVFTALSSRHPCQPYHHLMKAIIGDIILLLFTLIVCHDHQRPRQKISLSAATVAGVHGSGHLRRPCLCQRQQPSLLVPSLVAVDKCHSRTGPNPVPKTLLPGYSMCLVFRQAALALASFEKCSSW